MTTTSTTTVPDKVSEVTLEAMIKAFDQLRANAPTDWHLISPTGHVYSGDPRQLALHLMSLCM